MLKSKIFLSLLLLLIPLLSFPVAAEVISSRVDLQGVSRIQMDGSSELYFTQGDDEYVKITAEREILDTVDARVKGNLLHLSRKRQGWGSFNPPAQIRFDVQLQDLSQLRVNGAGDVVLGKLEAADLSVVLSGSCDLKLDTLKTGDFRLKMNGSSDLEAAAIETKLSQVRVFGSGKLNIEGVATDRLDIVVSGSGDIDVARLEAEEIEITINGSGYINLSGAVEHQRLEVNGSGKYHAPELHSRTAEIEVNGSGNVEVSVEEHLSTFLSRGGEVTYHAGPDLEIETGGSGKVRRAD